LFPEQFLINRLTDVGSLNFLNCFYSFYTYLPLVHPILENTSGILPLWHVFSTGEPLSPEDVFIDWYTIRSKESFTYGYSRNSDKDTVSWWLWLRQNLTQFSAKRKIVTKNDPWTSHTKTDGGGELGIALGKVCVYMYMT